jgi:hypothetical protein
MVLDERARGDVRVRFRLTLAELVERVASWMGETEPLATAGGVAEARTLPRLWLDDLYLAVACAVGDERAWRELDERYFDYVRRFAQRFDLGGKDADDVADDVIADLWRRKTIARYQGRRSLSTWLGALVTHAALNVRAARARRAARGSARRASGRGSGP